MLLPLFEGKVVPVAELLAEEEREDVPAVVVVVVELTTDVDVPVDAGVVVGENVDPVELD